MEKESAENNADREIDMSMKRTNMKCECGCDTFLEGIRVNELGRERPGDKPGIWICINCKNKYNIAELRKWNKI